MNEVFGFCSTSAAYYGKQGWPILGIRQYVSRPRELRGIYMIMKTILAAVAIASTMAIAAPAQAGVKVYLGGGFFDNGYGHDGYPDYRPDYQPGYEPDYQPDNFYEPPRRPRYRGISCEDGAQQVREEGYRRVRVVECDGRQYTYKARRNGGRFVVVVSRRRGDIVSVEQVY